MARDASPEARIGPDRLGASHRLTRRQLEQSRVGCGRRASHSVRDARDDSNQGKRHQAHQHRHKDDGRLGFSPAPNTCKGQRSRRRMSRARTAARWWGCGVGGSGGRQRVPSFQAGREARPRGMRFSRRRWRPPPPARPGRLTGYRFPCMTRSGGRMPRWRWQVRASEVALGWSHPSVRRDWSWRPLLVRAFPGTHTWTQPRRVVESGPSRAIELR
jgi:hypothetical protein